MNACLRSNAPGDHCPTPAESAVIISSDHRQCRQHRSSYRKADGPLTGSGANKLIREPAGHPGATPIRHRALRGETPSDGNSSYFPPPISDFRGSKVGKIDEIAPPAASGRTLEPFGATIDGEGRGGPWNQTGSAGIVRCWRIRVQIERLSTSARDMLADTDTSNLREYAQFDHGED